MSKHSPSVNSYVTGFILSIILTLSAYTIVTQNVFTGTVLIGVIAALAIIQLVIQLLYFLHLGKDEKPRLTLMTFLFMLLVVFILVAGSLWIMHNLNYNMMPHEVEQFIFEEEGIRP